MRDPLDVQIRRFTIELLEDAPEAPPFPHPDMVFVKADQTWRTGHMTETQHAETGTDRRNTRGGLAAALAILVTVIAIAGVVAVFRTGSDTEPSATADTNNNAPVTESADTASAIDLTLGADAVVGTTGEVVGGLAGSRPQSIEFRTDGTYRVVESGIALDTGDYTTDGEILTFESAPTDEVQWVRNDTFLRVAYSCDGIVGAYRVQLTEPNHMTLEAVQDECQPRITVANGLQLDLTRD